MEHKIFQSVLELQKTLSGQSEIVFTNGCFDLLHVGHVTYLAAAKAKGQCLIIGVNDDASVKKLKGESRPINTLIDRMKVLAALESVDYVIPFSEDTPLKLIDQLRPNILVKGGDYTLDTIVGSNLVIERGGRVEVISFVEGKSTTAMIERMK